MESLHWVVLWAFIRAAPIPRRDIEQCSYSALCKVTNSLLDHSVVRAGVRIWPPVALLDRLLERYAPLLEDTATYSAMPWHLYESDEALTVPWDRAHAALRRMLLSEIVKLVPGGLGGQVDDIFLDTTTLRDARDFWDGGVARWVPSSSPAGLGCPEFRQILLGTTGGNLAVRPLKRALLDRDPEAVKRDSRPSNRRLQSTVLRLNAPRMRITTGSMAGRTTTRV